MSKKIIKINCEGTQYVDFHELNEFQEDIKTISREDLDKLKESIKSKGIIMPGFVWKHQDKWWILDMHQRFRAFIELEKEGWYIPNVPVVEIFAKTKREAKEAVTIFISQYGKVDEKKLKVYLDKYQIKLKTLVIRSEPIRIKSDINKKIKTETLQSYKRIHILFSFHPDKLIEIKQFIEEIKKVEGVEFEQGEN